MAETRHQLTEDDYGWTLDIVKHAWIRRLNEKGMGIFVSRHESLGVIAEEFQELLEAVRGDDEAWRRELMDCAVAIIHAIASHDTEKQDKEEARNG